jgi:hypothetical protein
MFTSHISKPSPFDVYNVIQTQFNTIKMFDYFVNYLIIPPIELINISNMTLNCVDKLGDISALYIRKIHDSTLSVITTKELSKMFEIHNELLDKLYKFNGISVDICNNMKNIEQYGFNQYIQNYMHYDIINRYKLLILQIIDIIKRINVYVELIKDKIT